MHTGVGASHPACMLHGAAQSVPGLSSFAVAEHAICALNMASENTAAAAKAKPALSSKILGLKFMQRAQEKKLLHEAEVAAESRAQVRNCS
eukprot:353152-Chlamydomonas_euryale.AAC.6